MDKIWDRNPSKSEFISRCGRDEKTMTTQNRQKSNAKNKFTRKMTFKKGFQIPSLRSKLPINHLILDNTFK